MVVQNFRTEGLMQSSEGTKQWQVTCVRGWRTLGSKEDVVSAVIGHGMDTHSQEVTEEQALTQVVPVE